jgi:hypothetical protein
LPSWAAGKVISTVPTGPAASAITSNGPAASSAPNACVLYGYSSVNSSVPRRRLAAGGATQRLPAGAAGSLARWQVASPPSHHRCRAARAAHSNRVRRTSSVVMQDTRMPTAPCGRPVRVLRQRPRVQRPRVQRLRVQRPPVQRPPVRCPRVWCPMPGVRVRCPEPRVRRRMSGVRCPVRASGIRAYRIRVRSVRTGGFVEREGAAGSHTPRDRPGRRLTPLQGSRCARFAHCGRLRAGQQERAAGARPATT